jgi:hypothetical protein
MSVYSYGVDRRTVCVRGSGVVQERCGCDDPHPIWVVVMVSASCGALVADDGPALPVGQNCHSTK